MLPIEQDISDYLAWMRVHNYAATTIENRTRYLSYFVSFIYPMALTQSSDITLELLLDYQVHLYDRPRSKSTSRRVNSINSLRRRAQE